MRRRELMSRVVSSYARCDLIAAWYRSRNASIYLCLISRAVYRSRETIYPDIVRMTSLQSYTWLARPVPSGIYS
jgi:hypothetical protein